MATENKWTERAWAVVSLLAAVAGGGACVKVMIGSPDGGSVAPGERRGVSPPVQPVSPPVQTPCPPAAKSACGSAPRW